MAQSQTEDDRRAKADPTELDEGDRVFMGINLHGLCEDVPGTEYDDSIYQSGVEGTITEALTEREKELLEDGRRPMADLTVETDDGRSFTWNVDNGYVLGYNKKHDRHTDVGKIGGFYEAE